MGGGPLALPRPMVRETAGPRVGGKHTAAAEAAVREESSRVDVQGVAEFPVVVREVLSSTGPQSELDAAMATYAVTLGCLTAPRERLSTGAVSIGVRS